MITSSFLCIKCFLRPLDYLPQTHRCFVLSCIHKQDKTYLIQYKFSKKIFFICILNLCFFLYVTYQFCKTFTSEGVYVGIPYKINIGLSLAGILSTFYCTVFNIKHKGYKFFIYTLNLLWQPERIRNKSKFQLRLKTLKKTLFKRVIFYFCFLIFSILLNILGLILTNMRYSFIQFTLSLIAALYTSVFTEILGVFAIIKSNLLHLMRNIKNNVKIQINDVNDEMFKNHLNSYILLVKNLRYFENYVKVMVIIGYPVLLPVTSISFFVVLDFLFYSSKLPNHELIIIPILCVTIIPILIMAIYFARLFDELKMIVSSIFNKTTQNI